MYKITKQQEVIENYKINTYYYQRARDGFKYLLTNYFKKQIILLPSYIGYSSREGSGIFDPVKEAQVDYLFYSVNRELCIKKEELFNLIDSNPNSVLLLVHYFGFIDTNINLIKEFAKKRGVVIIEDCAHGFYTFFNNPIVDSDFYLFSLHKMFVYKDGGLLISKKSIGYKNRFSYNPFEYNIQKISEKRVNNYNYLLKVLEVVPEIKILKKDLGENIPQTLPILLTSEKVRDFLYFKLNKLGFGVVSLYHELIKEIKGNYFSDSFFLSKHILNLPIHQDVEKEELLLMVKTLKTQLEIINKKGF